jgi:hypothetical protein
MKSKSICRLTKYGGLSYYRHALWVIGQSALIGGQRRIRA